MSYEAEHPKGTDIIKLDDAEHSTNIQRVSCETNEDLEGDDHLTILHMKDSEEAEKYKTRITRALKLQNNERNHPFLTGSFMWG